MNPSAPSIDEIFSDAIDISSAADREAYLNRACGNDREVRERVEKLIANYERAGSFLEYPSTDHFPTEMASPYADLAGAAVGTSIGPYRLRELLGEGGMGVVYIAEQSEPIKRRVALKVIKPGMDSREVVARFEAERQALALMDHPNIARVFDGGQSPPVATGGLAGRPYFVMELVRGLPITDYCDQVRLPARERLRLFADVCRAVQHAHQKGIIHRDLKPSNVLVTICDGKSMPKVIDFGIAKAIGPQLTEKSVYTRFSQLVGTPMYMSPEQAELSAQDVDTRADVYSLGVLLYELLTGATPFDPETLRKAGFDEVRRIIREDEPPRPSARVSTLDAAARSTASSRRRVDDRQLSRLLHGDLDWIVMKALEKDRNRRYESAGAFTADIERYLMNEPIEARPPSAAYRLQKFVRRNRVAFVICSMAAAMLLAIGWWAADWHGRRTEANRAVDAALAEADNLQGQGKYFEALSAARRAEGLAGNTAGRELQAQVQRRRAELELVLRLDEIRLEGTGVRDGRFDGALTDRRYEDEFQSAGFALFELAAEAAAERIRATSIASELAAVLNDWAPARRADRAKPAEQWKHLLAVAYLADPDPIRDQFRQAVATADNKAIKAAALNPAIADGQPFRFQITVGNTLERMGDTKAAIKVLYAAYKKHPNDFWVNHSLGSAYLFSKPPQFDQALRHLTVAVAIRPQSPGARLNLGLVLKETGRESEAIDMLREAIRLKPDYDGAFENLAECYLKTEQVHEAFIAAQEAVRIKPTRAMYRVWVARVHSRTGRTSEAIEAYREAIRLNPNLADAYSDLALSQRANGQNPDAESTLRKVIELRERAPMDANTATRWAGDCCNLGVTLVDMQRGAEAVGFYDKAITKLTELRGSVSMPKKVPIFLRNCHMGRGEALLSLKRETDALPDFERALEFDDGVFRQELLFRRAHCLVTVDLKRAMAAVEEVVRTGVKEPLWMYGLGLVCASISAKETDPDRREVAAVKAIEHLRNAAAAGFFKEPSAVANLKTEKDLDPLRNREDFREFLKSLEGNTKR